MHNNMCMHMCMSHVGRQARPPDGGDVNVSCLRPCGRLADAGFAGASQAAARGPWSVGEIVRERLSFSPSLPFSTIRSAAPALALQNADNEGGG